MRRACSHSPWGTRAQHGHRLQDVRLLHTSEGAAPPPPRRRPVPRAARRLRNNRPPTDVRSSCSQGQAARRIWQLDGPLSASRWHAGGEQVPTWRTHAGTLGGEQPCEVFMPAPVVILAPSHQPPLTLAGRARTEAQGLPLAEAGRPGGIKS